MIKNMGSADRVLRLVISAVLIGLFFSGIIEGILGIVGLALAAILILTSLVGFCPLYYPFGIKSYRSQHKK